MNKVELIAKIAEKAESTKKDAEKMLEAYLETITETLKAGDKIQLVGFGTFDTSVRKARVGRNPQTGKEIEIPETIVPKFKAGKLLKENVK